MRVIESFEPKGESLERGAKGWLHTHPRPSRVGMSWFFGLVIFHERQAFDEETQVSVREIGRNTGSLWTWTFTGDESREFQVMREYSRLDPFAYPDNRLQAQYYAKACGLTQEIPEDLLVKVWYKNWGNFTAACDLAVETKGNIVELLDFANIRA